MFADDDLTDEERALLGDPPKRKRKLAPVKAAAPKPRKRPLEPARGGIRQRRIRIPAFNEMSAIRSEMSRIYRTVRLAVGEDFDSSTAKTLIDCLRAIAAVRSVEVADELGLLEELVKKRSSKKGGLS